MGMNFPASPTTGQLYPQPPVAGVPVYRWDGQKWTMQSAQPKAVVFADGSQPMTGQLTLVGDPVNPTDAADKSYIDAGLAALAADFPSGTTLLFYQGAAPTGWTKLTAHNDKALRVVSGSGGVAGGTNPFSTVMAQTNVGNHALLAAEIPTINVNVSGSATLYIGGNSGYNVPWSTTGWAFPGYPGPASGPEDAPYISSGSGSRGYSNYASGTVSISGSSSNTGGGPHNHPITMQIQYCDVILASKN
jgi:hypothetical protein